MLCKHEVVGSIPSGSTRRRIGWLIVREIREIRGDVDGLFEPRLSSRVLSDIVKRWFVLPVRGLHVSLLRPKGVRLLTGPLQGEPRSKLVLIFQDWWSFSG